MTAYARTVLGDVDTALLGVVDAHEHVLISGGMQVYLDRDFLLNDRAHAIEDYTAYRTLGGGTAVDMSPPGLGRDPEGLRAVSQAAGIHIIAATGFHMERYYDSNHWLYQYSAEEMAELFRSEIEEGMDQGGFRGPLVKRSAARAGVLKVATGYYTWNANTDRWFEAAAMAQQMTGVPISSHTENGVMGDRQADRLMALGVPASSIVIGHIDKNADPYVHRDLAARGVYLEYDSPSRLKYGPDANAVNLIAAAARDGYADRILLGLDFARRSYYASYGGGPGIGYLLETFIPRLRAEGLEEVVDLLLVQNPARAFAMYSAEGS